MKYLTEERFIVSSNTREATRNYNANYDRIFRGDPEPPQADSDGIEAKITTYVLHCNVCERNLDPGEDPDDHQYHAVFKITDEP